MKLGPFDLTAKNAIPWLKLGADELRQMARERFGGIDRRELRVLEHVLTNVPAGDPEAVLEAIDAFAADEAFLMNVGPEKGRILDRAVRDSEAGQALELGAFCGYSAIRIARLLLKPGSQLTSIELSATRLDVAKRMVEHAGLASRMTFIKGRSTETIPTLGRQFDMVFIDHAKELYLEDLKALEDNDLLKPGAIVVADNVRMFAEMDDYLGHVRSSGRYSSVHHDTAGEFDRGIPDTVEVSTWLGRTENE